MAKKVKQDVDVSTPTKQWVEDSVKRHILKGKELYQQLSEESSREVSEDVTGSSRKAELQAKKDAWSSANELLFEIARLEERYELSQTEGSILTEKEKKQDFKEGFAEKYAT